MESLEKIIEEECNDRAKGDNLWKAHERIKLEEEKGIECIKKQFRWKRMGHMKMEPKKGILYI